MDGSSPRAVSLRQGGATLTTIVLATQAAAVAPQSALEPSGPAAAEIARLWDIMAWLGGGISVVVIALLLYALLRRRRPDELPPEADRPPDPRGELTNVESAGGGREESGRPRSERLGARWMVAGGIAFPTVVLTALFVLSLDSLGALYPRGNADGVFTVEVIGRQWWWDVRYLDTAPQRIVPSANEIHIPVGQRVRVLLRSDDVIHSFWVPGLQGKMDMIPGRTTVTWLQADSAGTWRGQCAEYCGMQHAKMALVVVAEPPEQFARWLASEARPAVPPADSALAADREAFLQSGCVLCHTVRGTPARGGTGPDLTHVASRRTLAAGELPNTLGNLYGWIANPQALKPGSHMPAVEMTPGQLHAIARYVASLR
ncbi:MAG: cytochrome c oxidase subunit II [Gemmatimonadota bacterium]|nr:cytochrome c oxidase subunit II [Gemmatimonadota bacterium]